MIIQAEHQFDFINMVANRLVEKFKKSLFALNKGKSYAAHVGCLDEILDWAWEFYEQYYDVINNWEMFKRSSGNIYNAVTPDDLIVAFGWEREKRFMLRVQSRLMLQTM